MFNNAWSLVKAYIEHYKFNQKNHILRKMLNNYVFCKIYLNEKDKYLYIKNNSVSL